MGKLESQGEENRQEQEPMWPEPQSRSHPRNIYRGPAVTIPGPWCTTAPNTSVVTLDMGAMRKNRDLLALEHPRLSPWSSAPIPL